MTEYDPDRSSGHAHFLLGQAGRDKVTFPACRAALRELAQKAELGADRADVSVRVAERGGRVYLDLGGGRAARVTGEGMEVLPANQEVDFASSDSAHPLPDPDPAGDEDELGRVLGLGEDEWALVLGWMLGALKECGDHYCLVVEGEPSSGKSTPCEQVAAVLDPKGSEKLKFSRSSQDVFVTARRRWILGFDEVGRLTEDQCGTLKSIATGASHAGRKLYTDGQEYSFRVNRPVYLNGTGCLLADPALLRRTIPLWRPAFEPGRKRTSRTRSGRPARGYSGGS